MLIDHPGAHVHIHATSRQAQYCTMPYHTPGAHTFTLLMLELMRVTVTTAACKGPPPDHRARVKTKGPAVSEHNWGSVPPNPHNASIGSLPHNGRRAMSKWDRIWAHHRTEGAAPALDLGAADQPPGLQQR